jgi:hypothetical protein
MTDIIETLKLEHRQIVAALDRLKNTGKESHFRVELYKDILRKYILHTAKELRLIYKHVLIISDDRTSAIDNILKANEKVISILDRIIDEKDEKEDDHEKIKNLLMARITIEEEDVFPEYEKLKISKAGVPS